LEGGRKEEKGRIGEGRGREKWRRGMGEREGRRERKEKEIMSYFYLLAALGPLCRLLVSK
jgi:hypothetical protein